MTTLVCLKVLIPVILTRVEELCHFASLGVCPLGVGLFALIADWARPSQVGNGVQLWVIINELRPRLNVLLMEYCRRAKLLFRDLAVLAAMSGTLPNELSPRQIIKG